MLTFSNYFCINYIQPKLGDLLIQKGTLSTIKEKFSILGCLFSNVKSTNALLVLLVNDKVSEIFFPETLMNLADLVTANRTLFLLKCIFPTLLSKCHLKSTSSSIRDHNCKIINVFKIKSIPKPLEGCRLFRNLLLQIPTQQKLFSKLIQSKKHCT